MTIRANSQNHKPTVTGLLLAAAAGIAVFAGVVLVAKKIPVSAPETVGAASDKSSPAKAPENSARARKSGDGQQ